MHPIREILQLLGNLNRFAVLHPFARALDGHGARRHAARAPIDASEAVLDIPDELPADS